MLLVGTGCLVGWGSLTQLLTGCLCLKELLDCPQTPENTVERIGDIKYAHIATVVNITKCYYVYQKFLI